MIPHAESRIVHSDRVTDPADYDLARLLDFEVNSTRFHMLTLYALARSEAAEAMVELGCYRGNTTALLAYAASRNSPTAHVWAVDSNREGDSVGMTAAHLSRLGLRDRVSIVEGFTWNTNGWAPRDVDLVFVDGQHDEEGVSRDFAAWWPRLRPGGYMAFHDVSGSAITDWMHREFPRRDAEHVLLPSDCGLLLARRVA